MTVKKPFPALAVAGISGGMLLQQVLLTRIFSVTMQFHFAYVAIAVGLMGLGAAGVKLFNEPNHALNDEAFEKRIFLELVKFAVSTLALVLGAVQLGVGWDNRMVTLTLAAACLLSFFPFYYGGLMITLLFKKYHESFAKLYAADLVAAGLGCFCVAPLLVWCRGPGAMLVSLLVILASCLISFRNKGKLRNLSIFLFVFTTVLFAAGLSTDLLKLRRPKGRISEQLLFEKWNLISRIAVYSDARHMPWSLGPKFTAQHEPPLVINIDSGASTALAKGEYGPESEYLRYEIMAAGAAIAQPGESLVIGAGGGRDVVISLLHGMNHVDAVEINPIIATDIMRDKFREESKELYFDPRVNVVVADGRAFLRATEKLYDHIQLSLVDSWAATAAGAFALTENSLYTVEALEAYLKHLKPDGILAISRWSGGNVWRLVGMFDVAARNLGLNGIANHLLIIEGKSFENPGEKVSNLLFRKSAFDATSLERLDKYIEMTGFDLVHHPTQLIDNYISNAIRAENPAEVVASNTDVEMRPSTDDWPFFFFGPPKDLWSAALANPQLLLIRSEYLLLELVFFSLIIGACFFIVPLLRNQRTIRGLRLGFITSSILYFCCLGVGFMVIEVAMMQRFILYLGHPSYSLALVLSCLLLGSGVGSLTMEINKDKLGKKDFAPSFFAIAVVIVLEILIAIQPNFFASTQGMDLSFRLLFAGTQVFCLGIVLGTLMPLGMNRLRSKNAPQLLPWAWGMNGFCSVAGASCAALLSIVLGFTVSLHIGAGFYLVAAATAAMAFRKTA